MSINVPKRAKKLVLVMTISMLVTEDSKELILINVKDLKQVTCI